MLTVEKMKTEKGQKNMKAFLCTASGMIGAAIAAAYGGWSAGLNTLLIFMGIDYASGLIVAGVFHNSPKSEGGALESRAGWKGLARKVMTLLLVLIGARLDMLLELTYIRDAIVIAFIINEMISILENAGLMGIPIPKALTGAIELLKSKSEPKNKF